MKLTSLLGRLVVSFCLCSSSSLYSQGKDVEGRDQVSGNYILGPTDGLLFRIIGEPEIEATVRVAADGTIALPYIGAIDVAGKTVQEVREQLYTLYDRDYFVNPQVYLLVTFYSEQRVNVLGQVNRPGPVVIPPEEELTILQAISMAGGFTRLANPKQVILKRVDQSGRTQVYKINVDEILKNPETKDWKLEISDTLDVPERRI